MKKGPARAPYRPIQSGFFFGENTVAGDSAVDTTAGVLR